MLENHRKPGRNPIQSLIKPSVKSYSKGVQALGLGRRSARSTRSHVVFTIYVESRSRVESSEKAVIS